MKHHRLIVTTPLLALLLAGCSGEAERLAQPTDGPSTSAPTTSATPTTATPTGGATAGSPTSPAPGSRAVAVYYVADTTNGPRLYREFHRRALTGDDVRDAVTAMLDQAPNDADYLSPWAEGTRVLGVTRQGTTLRVNLSEEAKRTQAGAAFEGSLLQQLVWTATAAEPSARAVQLLIEGKEVGSLAGHVDTSEPMRRGRPENELAPVWILTPTETATVRSGAEFGGEATVFEANVSWEVVQGGTVVQRGFSTATAGAPARGRWTATLDVPPGSYVLRAFESSAKDGSVTFLDTKRFTVV